MTRVRNTHGAPCCGLAPGAMGDVDESNAGVAAAIAGRLLVRASETARAEGPTDADVVEMAAEIARRDGIIATLSAELREAEAKNTEASAEHLRLSMQVESDAARIAALESDLAAASALLKDAGDSAAKKTRATREG